MTAVLTRNYDGYGSGFISPTNLYFNVNISKNASSYMADILPRQGWTAARYGQDNCDYSKIEKVLIILRDPIDRWISGVAQYLITRILNPIGPNTYIDDDAPLDIENLSLTASAFVTSYSNLIERFIFDRLDLLDDHVWAQSIFFENILPDVPRHYIMMDSTFEQELESFGIQNFKDADRNQSDNEINKCILKDFFRKRLESKPTLAKKITLTYAQDYELIKNAFPNR